MESADRPNRIICPSCHHDVPLTVFCVNCSSKMHLHPILVKLHNPRSVVTISPPPTPGNSADAFPYRLAFFYSHLSSVLAEGLLSFWWPAPHERIQERQDAVFFKVFDIFLCKPNFFFFLWLVHLNGLHGCVRAQWMRTSRISSGLIGASSSANVICFNCWLFMG